MMFFMGMLAMRTMNVTCHLASSRVSTNVCYLSFVSLECGGGVAILEDGKFNKL